MDPSPVQCHGNLLDGENKQGRDGCQEEEPRAESREPRRKLGDWAIGRLGNWEGRGGQGVGIRKAAGSRQQAGANVEWGTGVGDVVDYVDL